LHLLFLYFAAVLPDIIVLPWNASKNFEKLVDKKFIVLKVFVAFSIAYSRKCDKIYRLVFSGTHLIRKNKQQRTQLNDIFHIGKRDFVYENET